MPETYTKSELDNICCFMWATATSLAEYRHGMSPWMALLNLVGLTLFLCLWFALIRRVGRWLNERSEART